MVKIEFKTDGAAFEDSNYPIEVECILKAIIKRVKEGHTAGTLRDTNGNTIGKWFSNAK